MTAADNKALFRSYSDALMKHPENFDEFLHPDFVAYDLPEGRRGIADLKDFRERANKALSGESVTFDYLVAENDLVAAYVTIKAKPSPGEEVMYHITEIVQVKDNLIAWRRLGLDRAGYEFVNRRINQHDIQTQGEKAA